MKSVVQKGAIGLVLLGAGVWIGEAMTLTPTAQGEVRPVPPPPTFQSGGQLSVPILREIAATLAQIDTRLARIEAAAQKLDTGRPGAPNARRPGTNTVRTD